MEAFSKEIRELKPGAILVRVAGALDAGTSIQLEMDLAPHLSRPGTRDVVMEVPDLTFVSSSGLRVFMIIIKSIAPRQGRLFMVGAGPQVVGMIRMAGMGKMFQFRDTIQECEL